MAERERFTRIGFLFATLGSVIGLGVIWGFPMIMAKNGGGSYLIAYVVALIILGIPLLIAEFMIGKHFQGSAPFSLKKITKNARWIGWSAVLLNFFTMLFYTVIAAWALGYLIMFAAGNYAGNTTALFSNFIASPYVLILTIIFWIAVFSVLRLGIKKGIERVVKFLIPALWIILIALMINSLMLPGAIDGVVHYMSPNGEVLLNPVTWMQAFGQVFFTLSLAAGIMIVYGSHMRKDQNMVEDAFAIGFASTLFAVLISIVIFATLFAFSTPISSGGDLVFVSLPLLFQNMAFGQFLGILFFALLVIAAFSPTVSSLEGFTSSLMDKLHFSRSKATLFILIIGASLSMFFALMTQYIDSAYVIVLMILPVIGIAELLVFAHHKNFPAIAKEHIKNKDYRKFWTFCVKYLAPAILFVLIVSTIAGFVL